MENDKTRFIVMNNRHKQYGKVFKSRKEAENWLAKKITSPFGRMQFYVVEIDRPFLLNGEII